MTIRNFSKNNFLFFFTKLGEVRGVFTQQFVFAKVLLASLLQRLIVVMLFRMNARLPNGCLVFGSKLKTLSLCSVASGL
jgi:hypothetical protein